jgi:hypothetical protein
VFVPAWLGFSPIGAGLLAAASLPALPIAAPLGLLVAAGAVQPLGEWANDEIKHMYDPESRLLGK